jgi:hypothetical protein
MALLDVRKRQAIQEVVDRWRERCLLGDGSLLFDGEQVWTPENLALLYHNVIEAPLEDERSFLEKYREQLQGSRELVLLGAEAMAVYYLFVWIGAVTAQTKRERLNEVLSWASAGTGGRSWRAGRGGLSCRTGRRAGRGRCSRPAFSARGSERSRRSRRRSCKRAPRRCRGWW